MLISDWQTTSRFAFLAPVRWVLNGVLWEGSDATSGVYLWRLAMPLYQQVNVVDLSWSERHGGGAATFEADDHVLRAAVAEVMSEAEEAERKGSILLDMPVDNVGTMEVRRYGLAVMGNWDGAVEVLERVLRHEPKFEWQRARRQHAGDIKRMIETGDRAAALDQILEWRVGSLRALGIERYGEPIGGNDAAEL